MESIFEIRLDKHQLEKCVLQEKEGKNVDNKKVRVSLNFDFNIKLSEKEQDEFHQIIERLATILTKGHKSYFMEVNNFET